MKRLLILSGKGGTGKTTTAASFIHFSQAKAFADCDIDAPNLLLVSDQDTAPEETPFYGSEKAIIDPARCVGCGLCAEHCRFNALIQQDGIYQVNEFACEGCGVCEHICPQHAVKLVEDQAGTQALYQGDRVFSTAILKMGRGNSGKLVSAVKLALLKHAPECDLAVFDGSPGIGCPVIASISGMDLILVVAEPSLSGISDLERLIRSAEVFQTKIAVCVNKWDASPENTNAIEMFCKEHDLPFVGRIPYDKTASKAINAGKSVAELDCPARSALLDVYHNTMQLLDLA